MQIENLPKNRGSKTEIDQEELSEYRSTEIDFFPADRGIRLKISQV